jgi:hypothetical protein
VKPILSLEDLGPPAERPDKPAPPPQPPRPPYDPTRAAMALLALLIISGVFAAIGVGTKCTLWHTDWCEKQNVSELVRSYLTDTIPILIALIVRGGPRN